MIFLLSNDAYKETITSLSQYGDVFLLDENKYLLKPEAKHIDMQLFKTSESSCIVHPNIDENAIKFLIKHNIKVTVDNEKYDKIYPGCVKLNCLKCNDIVFGNEKYISCSIKQKFNVVNVKQGYAGCSSIYVDTINTIITSDKSIEKAGINSNFNTKFVDNSKIILNGYNNGFIGGTMGYVKSINTLFVNGSLSSFDKELYSFLSNKVIIKENSKAISDIGGIITFA